MATKDTKEKFNLAVTVFEGHAEWKGLSESLPKTKLRCKYDGLRLTFSMRFSKGTNDPEKPVDILFDADAGALGYLGVQKDYMYKKPIVHVVWECRCVPPISNYTSSRADRRNPDYKFPELLLNEGVKSFRLRVPSTDDFSWNDWDRVTSAHEKCVNRRRQMLDMYPSPWDSIRHLPPISEAPTHQAVDTFPDIQSWGTVIFAALQREMSVNLSNQGGKGPELLGYI